MEQAVFSRILVPVDFSSGSERAWSLAQRVARAVGAELILMHVLSGEDLLRSLEPEERQAEARHSHAAGELNIRPQSEEQDIHKTAQRWAEDQLETWAAQAQQAGLKVRWLLRAGVSRREIVQAVREEHADLIVLATHGRGGIDRFLHGSVADPVIRLAPCPVLAVRDPAR